MWDILNEMKLMVDELDNDFHELKEKLGVDWEYNGE
jgi:hypothetical protein